MAAFAGLKTAYPWIRWPFIVSAPMLGAATPQLAVSVSRSGGMGFIAGGTNAEKLDETFSQISTLLKDPSASRIEAPRGILPIGVGFQLFNSSLDPLADVIAKHTPAAVWLFAPKIEDEFAAWSKKVRTLTEGKTRIWIQVGSVGEAMRSLSIAEPDVFVMQGTDAGGHGQRQSASIISLVPEVLDKLQDAGRVDLPVLAAGGITEARGVAAALALGASGAVIGTRFLVAEESGIVHGWKREILRTDDGGVTTLRSTLCDRLKETTGWPERYDGRAIRNKGHDDEEEGMSDADHIRLYKEELQQGDNAWGAHGRMVTYAGTGVGLVKKVEPAEQIVGEMVNGTRATLELAMHGSAHNEARPKL